MEILRVSNAGVLLELDGVKLLLDGFCGTVEPYLATPQAMIDRLVASPADLLAYTHEHEDHFCGVLTEQYCKKILRPVLGPENLPFGTTKRGVSIGGVSIVPVKSRHIGKESFHIPHVSYSIWGSKRVWFMGDAVPSQWINLREKADVIIAPFAYAATESAWHMTCSLAKEAVVLVHMPLRDNDPASLWPMVEQVTGAYCPVKCFFPSIGDTVTL